MTAVSALTLSSCGGSGAQDQTDDGGDDGQDASAGVELEFIRPGDPAVVRGIFEPMFEEFAAADVQMVDMGWGEYFQRLPSLIAANRNPDVQQVQQSLLYSLIDEGAYLPITDHIDDDLRARIPDALWEAAEVDGETYFVPGAVGGFVLWYNSDLFEQAGLDPNEPPETWDEFIAAATSITDSTGVPGFGFPGQDFGDLVDLYASMYASFSGQPLWDPERELLTFTESPEGLETLQLLADLIYEHEVTQPNVEQFSRPDIQTMFRNGEVAMVIDGPWILGALEEVHDLSTAESSFVRNAHLPQGQENGTYTSAGIEGWSISADTSSEEASMQLIKFLTEPQNQFAHTSGYGLVPVQQEELEHGDFSAPHWGPLVAALEESQSRIKSPNAEALNSVVQSAVASVVAGSASPSEAIEQARDQG